MCSMKKVFLVLSLLGTSHISLAQTGWIQRSNPIAPSISNSLGKIQFVSLIEGWVSAANGNLLHTTNSGTSWNIVTPFPNDTVSSIADPSISMCWINQTHGWKMNWLGTSLNNAHGAVIHQTTNGGISWTKKILSTAPGDAGLQVQFVDENNGWVMIYNFVSGVAKYLRTIDGGATWNSFNGAGIFYFIDSKNGWAITGGDSHPNPPFKIYKTTDAGVNWAEQYSDNSAGGYNAIQFTDINNGWIIGDNSKILKTTDGGANWISISNTGINSNAKSKCLFFIDASTGWIGTNDGIIDNNPGRVILFTTNGGSTWNKQSPPITNSIFSIFFWDKNNGWLTADNCVQNCNGADSLKIWQGAICHLADGGQTAVHETNNSMPVDYSLLQNYPNPFNPVTEINYFLPKTVFVTIKVYDSLGKEITTLVNGIKLRGNYKIDFDGSELASGIYFYKMQAGTFVSTKKLLLLK